MRHIRSLQPTNGTERVEHKHQEAQLMIRRSGEIIIFFTLWKRERAQPYKKFQHANSNCENIVKQSCSTS
jgi:hypothetical protein